MIKAVIIGASGYTGAELIRLLLGHAQVEITALTADSNAGKKISEIYPHLANAGLPDLVKLEQVDFTDVDVAFCCLPHATTQSVIKNLPKTLKIIDLSADFRIKNADAYQEWYGKPHDAMELQAEAVYGLTEHNREAIKQARIVACPGCYPTSMLLPLLPLLEGGVISKNSIIVDSKSGMSGAGRGAKTANLFTEMNENIKAYSIGGHRHVAEVEQELSTIAGDEVRISFTPQVVPMNRGILSNIYVELADGKNINDAKNVLKEVYKDADFVHFDGKNNPPSVSDVCSTNNCKIAIFEDRLPGRLVVVSVIDNLVKGASGQAVQNMNLMFGLDEVEGLEFTPVFP